MSRLSTNRYKNIETVYIERHNLTELFITAQKSPEKNIDLFLRQLSKTLSGQDANIIRMLVFGSISGFNRFIREIKNIFGRVEWPITYIKDKKCQEQNITGLQIHAVTGVGTKTIYLDEKPSARLFEDDSAIYCAVGNIHPRDRSKSPEEQTHDTLMRIERVLREAGMGMKNIIRTWFFNDNILQWYDKFNRVRTDFYSKRGIFDSLIPASTGIGGANPQNVLLTADAIAIQLKNKSMSISEVPSPLQNPACDYGSSFSRAVELKMNNCVYLYISGTASINKNGATTHIKNLCAQIDNTMQIVEAILKSKRMDYSNVTRSIAYFKFNNDIDSFNKYLEKYGLSSSRVLTVQNDVCRDELLFEIEIDAFSIR